MKQFFKTGQIFKQKSIDNPSFPGDLFSPIHVSASKSYFSRKGFVSLGCQLCEISLSYLFIKSLLFYKVPSNILQLFSPCFVCILPSFLFWSGVILLVFILVNLRFWLFLAYFIITPLFWCCSAFLFSVACYLFSFVPYFLHVQYLCSSFWRIFKWSLSICF